MNNKIRVLIVDDEDISRLIIRTMLADAADIEVVGEVASGEEAVAQAAIFQPDVILMDLVMPVMNGVEASRRVLAERREARIVAFTSLKPGEIVLRAARAGVRGCLQKPSSPEELARAVRSVHGGELVFSAELARGLLTAMKVADPGSRRDSLENTSEQPHHGPVPESITTPWSPAPDQ